ncbi:MAG: hypothetical protein WBM86_22175 [Waterburya sp.]
MIALFFSVILDIGRHYFLDVIVIVSLEADCLTHLCQSHVFPGYWILLVQYINAFKRSHYSKTAFDE